MYILINEFIVQYDVIKVKYKQYSIEIYIIMNEVQSRLIWIGQQRGDEECFN